jgi:esterase/lipase superfamily enzyme
MGRHLAIPVLALIMTACQTQRLMVPTPNLYLNTSVNPFTDVPAEFRTSEVDLLYLTDRKAEGEKDGSMQYGVGRSLSAAWGSAKVNLGKDVDWDTLVTASLEKERSVKIPVTLGEVRELGRFPATPAILQPVDGQLQVTEKYASDLAEASDAFRDEVRRRLAKTSTKEVYLMVHGYHNTFSDTALVIAEIWHFMGREGVPIHYTWPAGESGAMKGYMYDRESSEFTVHHFKQAIRLLASCEELEAINLIGHSRGTDVVSNGIRELEIEARARGGHAATEFKIRNVILASPDIDMDVVSQRYLAERITNGAKRITIYVSTTDKAIKAASTLFGSTRRLGQLEVTDLTEDGKSMLSHADAFQFIDAQISGGFLNHSYFHDDPSVSSDVILVLKYDDSPGKEHGRPLIPLGGNFWRVTDGYPVFEPEPES